MYRVQLYERTQELDTEKKGLRSEKVESSLASAKARGFGGWGESVQTCRERTLRVNLQLVSLLLAPAKAVNQETTKLEVKSDARRRERELG